MSLKAGLKPLYQVNEGDSPLNLSHVSEGDMASPVRIVPVHRSNDVSEIQHPLKQINNSENDHYTNNHQPHNVQVYDLQNSHDLGVKETLNLSQTAHARSEMMGGLKPKEFAAMQVYGLYHPSASKSEQKARQKMNASRSLQSSSQKEHQIVSNLLGESMDQKKIIETDHANDWNDQGHHANMSHSKVDRSRFTIRSEALMKQITESGKMGRQDERLQSPTVVVESEGRRLLLSEEHMYQFEKENAKNKKKQTQRQHERVQSQKERELLERLYYDESSAQEKEIIRQQDVERFNTECPFSPKLFSQSYHTLKTSQSSQQAKREPTFYEQSIKMKTYYANHREILKDAHENDQMKKLLAKPKINRKTKQLSELSLQKKGLSDVPVIQRLTYEKKVPEQPKDTFTYIPQISQHAQSKLRNQKVDDILYSDAKRRQKEEQHEKSVQSLQKSSSIMTKNHLTKNTIKAVSSKFDKEFQQAAASMAFSKDPNRESMPESISYLECVEILQRMRFISEPKTEENLQISMQVQRVWNQLSNHSERQRVLVRNLEVFLFAVQDIRADADMIPFVTEDHITADSKRQPLDQESHTLHPDNREMHHNDMHFDSHHISGHNNSMNIKLAQRVEHLNSQLSESNRHPIGHFDHNDNLAYSDEQVHQIHRLFKDLADNRLQLDKPERIPTVQDTFSYAPQISSFSHKLALEKRDRVIQDLKSNEGFDGGPLDMNEILSYQQQLTRYKTEELKLKLIDDRMNECTFHPQTNDFSKVEKMFSPRFKASTFEEEMQGKITGERRQGSSTKPLGVHRSVELYSLSKPQNQRRDRNKGDIEYERDCDECTFSPDISHIKLLNFNASEHSHMQSQTTPNKLMGSQAPHNGVDKTVQRLKHARVAAKVNDQLVNSGSTLSDKKRQSVERQVQISLSQEKHHHERPQGRFISSHSHPRQQRVIVQQSPKPPVYSPQDTIDSNILNVGEDSSRNARNQEEHQDVVEYFLKAPQEPVVEKDKERLLRAPSKTMEEERVPLLFVDVNIEDGKTARIIVYEGEKSEDLAYKFAQEHNLDAVMTGRLKDLLDQQINSLLTKIDEEIGSDHDEEESGEDEQGNYIHRGHQGQHSNKHHHPAEEHHQKITENNFDHPPVEEVEDDRKRSKINNNNISNNSSNLTEQEIRDMQMRALANTFKNFAEKEERQYIYEEKPSMSAEKPSLSEEKVQPLKLSNDQNIMDLHMRALATTFKNYSESEVKQRELPPDNVRQVVQTQSITKEFEVPKQVVREFVIQKQETTRSSLSAVPNYQNYTPKSALFFNKEATPSNQNQTSQNFTTSTEKVYIPQGSYQGFNSTGYSASQFSSYEPSKEIKELLSQYKSQQTTNQTVNVEQNVDKTQLNNPRLNGSYEGKFGLITPLSGIYSSKLTNENRFSQTNSEVPAAPKYTQSSYQGVSIPYNTYKSQTIKTEDTTSIQEMQMKALAATFKNYSENTDKFNQ